MLTQEYLKSILRYNRSTGSFIWIKPPLQHPRLLGTDAGGYRKDSNSENLYCYIKINRRRYKRASLAILYVTGVMPALVDHKNGITTDDRYRNLRPATQQQNAWNTRDYSRTSPLPMGVRQVQSGRYQARIRHEGKLISLGVFDDPEQASETYQSFKKQHHGEFYAGLHRG